MSEFRPDPDINNMLLVERCDGDTIDCLDDYSQLVGFVVAAGRAFTRQYPGYAFIVVYPLTEEEISNGRNS